MILECEGWSAKLIAAQVPETLRGAVVSDLTGNLEALKKGRHELEACVARGDSEEQLRVCTQTVVKAIADYKHASKTAKGLESQSKPKPKAKAKAKAAASSAPEENP